MATNNESAGDVREFPDDPADYTPEQLEAAAAAVLHELERLMYAAQTAWQTLAMLCGLSERRVNAIERDAVEAEGQAMDDAEAAAEPR